MRNEAVANLKGTIRSQSFYDWCIEQNHEEWLKRWDYNLNNLDPNKFRIAHINKFILNVIKEFIIVQNMNWHMFLIWTLYDVSIVILLHKS